MFATALLLLLAIVYILSAATQFRIKKHIKNTARDTHIFLLSTV